MYLQVFRFHIKVKPLQLKLFSFLILLDLRLYGFFLVCITSHFTDNCNYCTLSHLLDQVFFGLLIFYLPLVSVAINSLIPGEFQAMIISL